MAMWRECQLFWVGDSNFASIVFSGIVGALLYYRLGPPEGIVSPTGITGPRDASF